MYARTIICENMICKTWNMTNLWKFSSKYCHMQYSLTPSPTHSPTHSLTGHSWSLCWPWWSSKEQHRSTRCTHSSLPHSLSLTHSSLTYLSFSLILPPYALIHHSILLCYSSEIVNYYVTCNSNCPTPFSSVSALKWYLQYHQCSSFQSTLMIPSSIH